jgi:type II secretory pathway component PulK
MIPKPAGGDQDRGGAVIAIYWALAVAAIAVVGLRFYSRRLIRATGIDNWVMLIGLV